MPCLILLDLIILIILNEDYKLFSSSLLNFLHPPVTSSLFDPNMLLSTLFSNALSLCSTLNVRDHVSNPYRTTGKIIVLYILFCTFFNSRPEKRRFWTEWDQALPEFKLLLISPESNFDLSLLFPNI
jgi:hypothetical protein